MSNPIIVALDLPTAEAAVGLASRLRDHVGGFKIGLGLLDGPGPATIDALVRLDRPVFADAKLHDIPSQVESAAYRLGTHGARWVTAHVSGGPAMLEAAVAGLTRGAGAAEAGVLGVSVLNSLDEQTINQVGFQRSPGQLVGRMAKIAGSSGCEGVVCSAQELNVVRQAAPGLVTVTPGIRPSASEDDQQRTATPMDAVARGADWLVVGRPITRADDPVAAVESILGGIQGGDDRSP